MGIHQHCLAQGYELYNCEIPQLRHGPNSSIHILWCTLSRGVMNHIVPLIRCETNERKQSINETCIFLTEFFQIFWTNGLSFFLTEFNTYSDHFDTSCAASTLCQFHTDLQKADGEQWLMCDKCLLWYHESCVYYTKQKRLPAHWFCGCSCIWY